MWNEYSGQSNLRFAIPHPFSVRQNVELDWPLCGMSSFNLLFNGEINKLLVNITKYPS